MRFSVTRVLGCVAGLLMCSAVGAVRAQDVEVVSVRFNNLRAPGYLGAPAGPAGNWLEATVGLNVKPRAGGAASMVSRVRVSLLLGFELPGSAGSSRHLEHYRAEAECVALETGRSDVRFYLPPEIVKRDRLHGDPEFWGVELAVGGKVVPAARAAYSTSLPGAEQRKNFLTRAAPAAAVNDGILLPQYLTPFVNEYPRATPSFVRREAR